jgi:hypothetical protein
LELELARKNQKSQFPKDWDEARVQRVLAHYENQTPEEAAAEDEAMLGLGDETVMSVPRELVPQVRKLIAEQMRRGRGKAMKAKKKYPVRLPIGWTLEEVEEVRKYYDAQTDEEAAAEDEAMFEQEAVMIVPRRLVPQFQKMITADHGKRKRPTRQRRRVA